VSDSDNPEDDPGPEDGPATSIDAIQPASLRGALLTYGVPFLGTVLLSVGIAGSVLGGYAIAQTELDLCGDPTISVAGPAESQRLATGPNAPSLDRLDAEDLSPAERRAIETALEDPGGEADVRGASPNLGAFERGALVEYEGRPRYVTVVSSIQCLGVDPLLLPLGLVAILLGVAGILTPPAYRRLPPSEPDSGSRWIR